MTRQFIAIPFLLMGIVCFAELQPVKKISDAFIVAGKLHVYPETWWTGMKNPRLQVLIRLKDIAKTNDKQISVVYPGVKIENIIRVKNPDYLFINLMIDASAKPGAVKIRFNSVPAAAAVSVKLLPLPPGNGSRYARGVQASDFIYLLMPDRFSNGDVSNDKFSELRDTVADRNNPLARHGGDLQGIENHLDYLEQLGVTTLWLTPVVENDMPIEKEPSGWLSGYHGYWFTDHYEIDRRLGGKSSYLKMVMAAHKKGFKIIQDAVYNHVGAAHWIVTDPPDSSWINQWPAYQGTNHREQALFDIHAAPSDRNVMEAGWFVPHLPDLNLKNDLLATYLIQQAIWMTETFQLDGWRIDTYKYCDPLFLNKINAALAKEFPAISSLGEAVVTTVAAGAYFCRNNLNVSWKSNLTGILDFPVCYAMLESMKKNYGWSNGVMQLYTTLAEDMLYKQPMNNSIFLDNHDMDRFFSVVREDRNSFNMGIGLLLTQRGIPSVYYGTEILMKNLKNPSDAMVREDFPGGFPGDPDDKFLASGRTKTENEAFDFVSKLARFRKSSSAIGSGALMQWIPSGNVYVYFRYNERQTIMCALNTDSTEKKIEFKNYATRTSGFLSATNVISDVSVLLSDSMMLPPRSINIMELKKRPTDNKSVH